MKKSPLIQIANILALSFPGISMAQNLFLADNGSGNIYEYTAAGVRSTFASVSTPSGLAFNSAGDLFVTSQTIGNIYEFTPGGVQSTFASGLNNPTALAFDSAGNLFESDFNSGNIYEFTPDGERSTFASGLQRPNGLAVNSAGNLFVASMAGAGPDGSIVEITPGGVKSVFASGLYPVALAFNSAGNLFESDSFGIFEYTPGGVQSTFISVSAFGPLGSTGPHGLAFDGAGNLFVAVQNSNTHPTNDDLDKVTPGGAESTFASGLYYPNFLAFWPVPEPSVWAMLGMSVLTLLGFRRKSV
jgi:sugar lactone lactonase YvrE